MKRLILMAVAMAFSAMSQAQSKNYMTFQAEITNRTGDMLYIKTENTVKELKSDKNGVFKDTLNVKKEGIYWVSDENGGLMVYLKNGYDLKMKMDLKNYNETIAFSGIGGAENNYLVKFQSDQSSYKGKLFSLNEADFNKEIDRKKAADLKELNSMKLDPAFVIFITKSIENLYTKDKDDYKQNSALSKQAFEQSLKQLNNTTPPTFIMDNYKGGNSKLEDYKGNYVYIDFWATWCGPCRAELPHLKKTEEKFQGKNVTFVSISLDYPKDVEKWKKMVQDNEMGGMQLIANKDTQDQLNAFFKINGIPRFVLLDPNGTIINSDAPRPSDPELSKMLDTLLKS